MTFSARNPERKPSNDPGFSPRYPTGNEPAHDPEDTGRLVMMAGGEPPIQEEDTGQLVMAAGGQPPRRGPLTAVGSGEQGFQNAGLTQDVAAPTGMTFEDLTIADALGQLWRRPLRTLKALARVAWADDRADWQGSAPIVPGTYAPVTWPPQGGHALTFDQPVEEPIYRVREVIQLFLRLIAFICAWTGTNLMANSPVRSESEGLYPNLPLLGAAFGLWIVAEAVGVYRLPRTETRSATVAPAARLSVGGWATRLVCAMAGVVFAALAWAGTANNHFTSLGFVAWIASVFLWFTALAPAGWNYWHGLRGLLARLRRPRIIGNWTLLALVAILLLGAHFRFTRLDVTPPEMTSDHVEKLLDAWRVAHGDTNVFFANNGGREPAQMYLLAFLSGLPGFNLDFHGLKVLSAVEGMIAIVVMFWMGRELIGQENRRLGTLVGLALAALVAASYWHTILSRMGLRIVLTTIITPLLLIYLARAMRENRRADYLKAGLVLGFGLYTYQAVRMLPVVITVGVALAFLFAARGWRARRDTIFNFLALVVIAAVVFVPLARYTWEHPEEFWRRTTGRLLGDDIVETVDENGNVVRRNASLEERIDALKANLPVLMSNIRNALLMFHWKGDVAWINGMPNAPTLDPYAGALLTVGLAAWLTLLVRRRDVVYLLVPLGLLIMLLPSALSIAYPIENPSHTRTSGALPLTFLIAALPLALIGRGFWRVLGGPVGAIVGALVVAGIVSGSYLANAQTYYRDYHDSYLLSSLPYSEAGQKLREFATTDGTFGNAFMIGYPFWWDHRAVGIDAGALGWPNGIVTLEKVPESLYLAWQRSDEFQLDPDKDLLFFLSSDDTASAEQLATWFPDGTLNEYTSYQPENTYRTFRVPAPGLDNFVRWVQANFGATS